MPPSFGTSGLRGLADELTDPLVKSYTAAFLVACPEGDAVFVGRDLRDSSDRIAAAVCWTVREAGRDAVDCGVLPTPALALAAGARGAAAVMVTGSHIPADRNGLKFYRPGGEISKADEVAIIAARDSGQKPEAGQGGRAETADALGAYAERYISAFGPDALAGLRLGVYRHSSVARDVLETVLAGLGAEVMPLAQSDSFIPVDTEAVSHDMRRQLAAWCADHGLDALISTDGDADRPMVADAAGRLVPGDSLGVLTARFLGARIVVTPLSSNDMVQDIPDFEVVRRTRIGSPFVVAEMDEVLARDPGARVVGFEANGGFLLGFEARLAGGLPPLMTRDALLPALAALATARAAGQTLAELVAALPARFTAADRLQNIDRSRAADLLDRLDRDDKARAAFFAATGPIAEVDRTDGVRLVFESGEVVHLRPSGNAPEFRIYAQAGTAEAAEALVARYIQDVGAALG